MATAIYEKIFIYCERGQDPGFWAEPLNAVSNGFFLIAGVAALWLIAQLRPEQRSLYAWTLALLALLIGVGSFAFHTFAESWASALDVIPIQIFMLLAVYGLCRRFFGWPILAAWAGLIGFLAVSYLLRYLPCGVGVFCASKQYFAAILTLLVAGVALKRQHRADLQAAGSTVLAAGAVFTVSLTLRSLDMPLCDMFTFGGYRYGLHYWWHTLNAVTLFLVIRAFWKQEADRTALGLPA